MGTKLNTFLRNGERKKFHFIATKASQHRILFTEALTGYMVANNSKTLCTINKSMRPGIAMKGKRSRVGGEYITSLFCSILKCRLMLSINRTINSLSAEIIDGFLGDIIDGAIRCDFSLCVISFPLQKYCRHEPSLSDIF